LSRTAAAFGDAGFNPLHRIAEQLATYDGSLSVATRDGFRAAWRHYVEFARVSENVEIQPATSKGVRTMSITSKATQ